MIVYKRKMVFVKRRTGQGGGGNAYRFIYAYFVREQPSRLYFLIRLSGDRETYFILFLLLKNVGNIFVTA